MVRSSCLLLLVALLATVYSKDYFVEKFEGKKKTMKFSAGFLQRNLSCYSLDESYKSRWVQSTAKPDLGEFKLSHGKFYGDAKKDLGK